jgi:hypothetical protein
LIENRSHDSFLLTEQMSISAINLEFLSHGIIPRL